MSEKKDPFLAAFLDMIAKLPKPEPKPPTFWEKTKFRRFVKDAFDQTMFFLLWSGLGFCLVAEIFVMIVQIILNYLFGFHFRYGI